jgi:DNA-binding response OmpR family regulator
MKPAIDWPESPVVFGPASRAPCVLLIDEDQGALGALRIYLLCAGYRVFAAGSADEALDLVRTAQLGPSLIDIVIADLNFTGDDDDVAIDKMRRLAGYNVPAVLLIDQASIEIGKPALAADVSRLRKPVNVDELDALIGEVLNRPKVLSLSSTEKPQVRSCITTHLSARPADSHGTQLMYRTSGNTITHAISCRTSTRTP